MSVIVMGLAPRSLAGLQQKVLEVISPKYPGSDTLRAAILQLKAGFKEHEFGMVLPLKLFIGHSASIKSKDHRYRDMSSMKLLRQKTNNT
ncbi:unnamed protein product [Clonostachys rhizophaga]|uniref:Uncharacterized protein n=1 Tax=Clonostachys rhizophaga TaxID=160324 RepID=A0A9N9YFG6_9HYPO|nr:unnamed protein product [Clonostachys rhizophaga]